MFFFIETTQMVLDSCHHEIGSTIEQIQNLILAARCGKLSVDTAGSVLLVVTATLGSDFTIDGHYEASTTIVLNDEKLKRRPAKNEYYNCVLLSVTLILSEASIKIIVQINATDQSNRKSRCWSQTSKNYV
ncbi:unnamed protein product [Caenorhabditis brenneri]